MLRQERLVTKEAKNNGAAGIRLQDSISTLGRRTARVSTSITTGLTCEDERVAETFCEWLGVAIAI